MKNAFITFNTFVKNDYIARCENEKARAIYQKSGGFKAFKRMYVKYNGFSEYLSYICGAELTTIQTYHLARMFYSLGNRTPSDIPTLLSAVSRQYDISFPAVCGILSKEYWSARFDGPIYS
tara:strand:+ start:1662 stop:2024 length:363 start_codon:yes stop_codon:yes gene_type:complete